MGNDELFPEPLDVFARSDVDETKSRLDSTLASLMQIAS